MLTLPTSVQAYLDPARKPAFDKAIAQQIASRTLTASQCRDFYTAKAIGETARLDFWCYLYDLWSATWGAGLKDLPEIPIGEKIWQGDDYTPAGAFDERRLIVAHRLTKTSGLFTGVSWDDKAGLRLMFTVWRAKGKSFDNVTSDFELDPPWRRARDETMPSAVECYWTPRDLVKIADHAVSVSPLQGLVKAALTVLLRGEDEPAKEQATPASKKAGLRIPKARSKPIKRPGRRTRGQHHR